MLVPIFWVFFVYLGYYLTNTFVLWRNKEKPNKYKGNLKLLLPLVILDGLLVTAIDLFMDPLRVLYGDWHWLAGGSYFGVPWGNFLGWFLVTMLITGIFRLGEYFWPLKIKIKKGLILVIPILVYCMLYVIFVIHALTSGAAMQSLVLIGSLLMLPAPVISLILFYRWRQTKEI